MVNLRDAASCYFDSILCKRINRFLDRQNCRSYRDPPDLLARATTFIQKGEYFACAVKAISKWNIKIIHDMHYQTRLMSLQRIKRTLSNMLYVGAWIIVETWRLHCPNASHSAGDSADSQIGSLRSELSESNSCFPERLFRTWYDYFLCTTQLCVSVLSQLTWCSCSCCICSARYQRASRNRIKAHYYSNQLLLLSKVRSRWEIVRTGKKKKKKKIKEERRRRRKIPIHFFFSFKGLIIAEWKGCVYDLASESSSDHLVAHARVHQLAVRAQSNCRLCESLTSSNWSRTATAAAAG